jgi:hypothetical protein
MSQVVRAIEAHDTGNRRVIRDGFSPLFQDVFSVKSAIREDPMYLATEYRIGVTIGSQVMVEQSSMREHRNELVPNNKNFNEELHEAILRTKRQVIEAIFGEFRTDFKMIERALYDRDYQKARDYLRVFEDKMYNGV